MSVTFLSLSGPKGKQVFFLTLRRVRGTPGLPAQSSCQHLIFNRSAPLQHHNTSTLKPLPATPAGTPYKWRLNFQRGPTPGDGCPSKACSVSLCFHPLFLLLPPPPHTLPQGNTVIPSSEEETYSLWRRWSNFRSSNWEFKLNLIKSRGLQCVLMNSASCEQHKMYYGAKPKPWSPAERRQFK